MSLIFDYLFGQYSDYETLDIVLEVLAVIFGFLSVWFSKQNNILVFPTGMINTSIFVYLLLKWGLLGDMIINVYYFIMSIYGWYIWSRKVDDTHQTPITSWTKKDKQISIGIASVSVVFVAVIYQFFNKWIGWVSYIDILTTALFFVGMWLMAKRKIENWILLIIGDVISIPLYFYKGFTFTSLQYLGFTILAIYGYLAWKKHLNKRTVIA
tara:strand:+ start:182395 stop:183027 length:633 start_codon:yes stop_codon:yes gene_type:complete